MNWLKIYLPVYLLFYFSVAFIVPTWRTYRQTGIWPVTFSRSPGAHNYIGRLMKWLVLGLFVNVLLFTWCGKMYQHLVPVPYLQQNIVRITGILLVHFSLGWIFLAQLQMGNSWRIGIDRNNKTKLVTHGIFSTSRNPVFLGMIVTAWGLFAILPNALSFFTAPASYWVIQIQIRLEEAFLLEQFGESYRNYQLTTKRLLL